MSDQRRHFKSKTELILYFLDGAKRFFALSVFCACCLVFFDLINPKLIGLTVDYVIDDNASSISGWLLNLAQLMGGRDSLLTHIWMMSLAVIFFAVISALFRYLFKLANTMGAEKLVKNMRDDLYEHIMYLPYAWQDNNPAGDIIQRCTSDVETIKKFLSEQLTDVVRIIVLIAMALSFMFQMNWKLALLPAFYVPFAVAVSFFFHSGIANAFLKVDEEEGLVSSIVQENLSGVRVVRAFGREEYERSRFEKNNEDYTGMWIHLMQILSRFFSTIDFLYQSEIILTTALCIMACIRGHLTAGGFISFLSYNTIMIGPVRTLGRVISDMSKTSISIDRVLYIMNSEIEKDSPEALNFPEDCTIRLDKVSFSYDGTLDVLNNITAQIKKGETVGIIGATGSGKSSLVHLLNGLYDLPEEDGTISIGGIDIRKIKHQELRKHIGMVLQEPILFSRKLKDNIGITSDDPENAVDMAAIRQAAGTSCLEKAIENFASGYDTYVGEKGVTLSGGQKQRTAIAQMLYSKPDIMIFDDSLSAVDAQTDAQIRHNLREALSGITTIIISHRISTVMRADRIFVLEHGRIIQSGTHEELIHSPGLYREVFELQSAKTEVDDHE